MNRQVITIVVLAFLICATLLLAQWRHADLATSGQSTAEQSTADESPQPSSGPSRDAGELDRLEEAPTPKSPNTLIVRNSFGQALPNFEVYFDHIRSKTDRHGRVQIGRNAAQFTLASPGFLVESSEIVHAGDTSETLVTAHQAPVLRGIVHGLPTKGQDPGFNVVLNPNRDALSATGIVAAQIAQRHYPTVVHSDGTFGGYNWFSCESTAVLQHSNSAPASKKTSIAVATAGIDPETRWVEFDLTADSDNALVSVVANLHFKPNFPLTGTADLEFHHWSTGREVVDVGFTRNPLQELVTIDIGIVPAGSSLVRIKWDDPITSIPCTVTELNPHHDGSATINIKVPNPGTVRAQLPGSKLSPERQWDYSVMIRDRTGRIVKRIYPRNFDSNTMIAPVAAGHYYAQGIGPDQVSDPVSIEVTSDQESFVSLPCVPAVELRVLIGPSKEYRTVAVCDPDGTVLNAYFAIQRKEEIQAFVPRGRYLVCLDGDPDSNATIEATDETVVVDIR